jgi:DNA-directed RNA polymerase subunit K/omega
VEKDLESVEKLKMNRYLQVIIASKYARLVNARLARERQEEQSEEVEPQPYRRVAGEALRALVDGKIEFESPEGNSR